MRAVVITVAAGVCVALLMPEMPANRVLASAPALSPVLQLLLAVIVGVIVAHRAWLAAGCAYLFGVAVWVVLWLRPSPPWTPSDNWFFETWLQFAFENVLLPALIFAAAAAIAHFLSGRYARGLTGSGSSAGSSPGRTR